VHGLGRARTPDPCGERLRKRRGRSAPAYPVGGRLVVAKASSTTPAAERQTHPVAAGAVAVRARLRTLATATIVAAGIVVVVAEPEEPDQPDDQEPDVEDAEPDHEDPALSGHYRDATATGEPPKGLRRAYLVLSVGRGSGTYVAV
jgi:hypothetical protein